MQQDAAEAAALAAAAFEHGNTLMQAGRFEEAAIAYRRALAAHRDAPLTHNNLAVALAEQGRFGSALMHYREAIRLAPEYAPAHYNCANAHRVLGNHAEAVSAYESALALTPNWPAALLNCGLAHAASGHEAAAEARYREALKVKSDYPEAHNNLGLALQLQGRLDEAMSHFDRALALAPEFTNAHVNRAQLRLLRGDFANGWLEYEWRWRVPRIALQPLPMPVWDGSAFAGRTLLLRAEQGLGDTIQLIRFAAPLQRAGITVFLECQATLVSLLSRAPGVSAAFARGSALPRCDAQIGLASLPRVMRIHDLDTVAMGARYLHADPIEPTPWQRRTQGNPRLRVGVAWRGSPTHPQDCHRSIAPAHFDGIARIPEIQLVSLQLGHRAPRHWRALEPLTRRADDPPPTLDETAAIIAGLDLVIACDTAVAHLAGALGVPVWIALPLVPDWRWLLERHDSPWYPGARLCRQTQLDRWDDVFAGMQAALAGLLQTRQAA